MLDASDLFLMSTMFVAKGKEKSKILFVGFDDFTAIEYAIIEQLASVADVNVINYSSKADNKFLYNEEIIFQLKNIAYINELPFKISDCQIEKSKLKQFLEDNLFSLNNNKNPVKISNRATIAGLNTKLPATSFNGYAIKTVISVPSNIYIPILKSLDE